MSTVADPGFKRIIVIDEQMFKIKRIKHFGWVIVMSWTLQIYLEDCNNIILENQGIKRLAEATEIVKGKTIHTVVHQPLIQINF